MQIVSCWEQIVISDVSLCLSLLKKSSDFLWNEKTVESVSAMSTRLLPDEENPYFFSLHAGRSRLIWNDMDVVLSPFKNSSFLPELLFTSSLMLIPSTSTLFIFYITWWKYSIYTTSSCTCALTTDLTAPHASKCCFHLGDDVCFNAFLIIIIIWLLVFISLFLSRSQCQVVELVHIYKKVKCIYIYHWSVMRTIFSF